MDLHHYRVLIDRIDDEILRLFKERMEISLQIANYKKENSLPVLDAAREEEKLACISEKAGEEMRSYSCRLFSALFELSREYQTSEIL